MSSRTDHYGFLRLGANDRLDENGHQFTDSDRVLMDRLAWLGAEGHRHAGAAAVSVTPVAPTLTQSAVGGSIPASRRVYYKVTLVDPNGAESAPSPEAFVDTLAAIAEPAAPSFAGSTTGGSLSPGQYFYVLSAWTTVNTSETKAVSPVAVTVPIGTSTNRVILTLPSLPAGATGFNVYRKKPGGARHDYIASVTGSGPTFTDTGIAEDCNRTLPVKNNTRSTNSVLVTFLTALAPGYTWKVYRSYVTGAYANGLLHWVVEETSEGSGVVTPNHTDTGLPTTAGSPPTTSQGIGGPPKVQLDDSAEVKGELPLARVSGFPHVVRLWTPGAVVVGGQRSVWTCEFPRATLAGCRAQVGRGTSPAAQPLIADVLVGSGDTPAYASVFAAPGDRPQVGVGKQVGARVAPTLRHELFQGDTIAWDVVQAGGGATPTDIDVGLMLYLIAHGYTSALSHRPVMERYAPAGLLAWYKAYALGLSNGAAVASFTDFSGAARHAAQATGSKQGVYLAAQQNGLGAVAYDGVDDIHQTGAFAVAQPVTAFVVGRMSDSGANDRVFFDGALSGTGTAKLGKSTGSWYVGAPTAVATATKDTRYHIHMAVINGASTVHRIGGGPNLLTGDIGPNGFNGITLGGAGNGTSTLLQGYIGEALFFAGALADYDANIVGRYLADMWALEWLDVGA